MYTMKRAARERRKLSIRKTVRGSTERPRLSVFRSLNHIYAQVIDDAARKVLAAASTLSPAIRAEMDGLRKLDQAKKVGAHIARICIERGVDKVVFDRDGFRYHGRVKALADGAREGGLKF